MGSKPSYTDLEKRNAELERQVRQYEEVKDSRELLSVLLEAFRYIPLCKTFEAAAREIFKQWKRLTGACSGYVALLSERGEENEVLFLDANGLPCDIDPDLQMPIRGLREIVYKTKDLFCDNDFSKSPWVKSLPEGHVKLENVLFAPLNIENKTAGVIGLINKPEGFTQKDIHIAKILGDLAAVALTYAISQNSLRESETKYRQLTETMIETLSVIDLDGFFLYANRNAARNLSGEKLDDITGKNIRQLLPDKQAEQLIELYQTVYSSKEPYYQEMSVQLSRGDTWFANTLKPVEFGVSQIPAILSVSLDITERKKAEISLHEIEEKYRVLFNTFPLGITITDQTGKIVEINNKSMELLGISRKDQLTRTIDGPEWRLIRTDGSDIPTEEWVSVRALKENRLLEDNEIGLVKPDGKTVWLSVTAAPLLLEKYGVVVTYGDITDRKQAEQNYQMLFREMLDGFALHEVICDEAGQPVSYRFLAVNPAFERMTGLKAEKIVGRDVLDVLPDLEPYWIETYGKVALSGEPAFFENYSDPIGKHFQVTAFRPSPHQFACIFSDITERKIAEKELKDAHERFLAVLDGIDATVYVSDMETYEILFMNETMKKAFGRDLTGKFCYEAFRKEPAPCFYCTNNQLLDQNGNSTGVMVWQDNNPVTGRWYINHDRAIKWVDGRMVRLKVATDITEMKDMETRLKQAQKMQSIGNLAGGIAHDFNNILFPILGLSEMLMDDLPADSPEHENASAIFSAGKRGSDLVKQILAFSRQSEQKKMPVRIQQVLKEVVKLSRSTIPVDIPIVPDIQNDCSMVMADLTQIHQIAMNLITNAYHAVEQKSGEIHVRLREVEIKADERADRDLLPGRYARLSVSDTGMGIDPAITDKIFDPYFTTKEQGKGTGLGLAVVYGIVKEHFGEITVQSQLGKGTIFDIYLPIMTKAEKPSSEEGREHTPVGQENVLLVDDEEAIAKLERQMLERLGYKVTMHVNSLKALDVFKTRPDFFDLVISDMTMPNMTGDRLAREMIAVRPDIPIIICTGFSERLNQEKAIKMGIKSFLMKPIIKSELARTVRNVLDERKLQTKE